jgi:two-component system response regulator FixJ
VKEFFTRRYVNSSQTARELFMGVPLGISYLIYRKGRALPANSSGWKSSGMTARDGPLPGVSSERDCGMNTETYKVTPSRSGRPLPAGEPCRSVYIVDDDPAVCHALTLLFKNANYAVKPFTSAASLLATVNTETSGVLILDLMIGDMSGLKLQAELRKRGIDLKIIFISGHGNVEKSVQAIKGGAVDFIEKPFTNNQLLNSVEEALLLASIEEKECRQRNSIEQRYKRLTPREREVMKFLVSGVSNRNLAAYLGLSSRTVEIHRTKIMRKMEAASLPELVQMMYSCGDSLPEEILMEMNQTLRLREDHIG